MSATKCKHEIELDTCALCTSNRRTVRALGDIEHPRGGVPIPGYVAPTSSEYRGVQSVDTAPPVRPLDADFFYVEYPRPRLEGKVSHLPPVGRPWWVAKGMTANPLTRTYVEGVPMDIEVPMQVLEDDRVSLWQDIGD